MLPGHLGQALHIRFMAILSCTSRTFIICLSTEPTYFQSRYVACEYYSYASLSHLAGLTVTYADQPGSFCYLVSAAPPGAYFGLILIPAYLYGSLGVLGKRTSITICQIIRIDKDIRSVSFDGS